MSQPRAGTSRGQAPGFPFASAPGTHAPAPQPPAPAPQPPAPAPGRPQPSPAPAGPSARRAAAAPARPAYARPGLSTPRWLRRAQVLISVGCLLLGILATGVLASNRSSVTALSANVDQLLRIQTIQSSLLAADVAATNSFLGSESASPAQLQRFDDAINATSAEIVRASRAQPADAAALAALNEQVLRYTEAIEAGRTNNRQGFQVGTAYLSDGSATLRERAMPIVDSLLAANTERIRAETAALGGLGLVAAFLALAVPAAMAWFWVQMARRFRRYVNIPYAVAAGAAALAALILLISVGSSMATAAALDRDRITPLSALAAARGDAADAKSYEALRLIEQSGRDGHEESWVEADTAVADALAGAPGLAGLWQAYRDVHGEIVTLDTDGNWAGAVQIATTDEPGGSNSRFAEFDKAAADAIAADAAVVSGQLANTATWLTVAAIATGLLAAVGIVGAAVGINLRIKEYQ